MSETFEQAQERVKVLQSGEPVERPIAEHEGYAFGARVRVVDQDEFGYFYEGDEGVLIFQEVGAPEHNNVRIDVGLILDGSDAPLEIDLDNVEPA